jgi:hypothetical protein
LELRPEEAVEGIARTRREMGASGIIPDILTGRKPNV